MYPPYEIKIKHGFEVYHRNRYGYYPSWDSQANAYLVKTAQEKWDDWSLFFQKASNETLDSILLEQMVGIYLAALSQKD